MTPELKQHFDELILKAVQSGKKETSGLVDHILQKMDTKIAESIEQTVNGKIKVLTQEFRDHTVIVDEYIKSDTEWKTKAEPVIQMGQNVQGFGKVSLYIVGFVSAVAGAIILILKGFK